MADISIIEWGVYGFIAYSSMLMLIISIVKEVPSTKSLAIARSIFLIPGIICAGILTNSGVNIPINTLTTNNVIKDLNTTDTWTEATSQSNTIIIQDPTWTTVHLLIMLVLLVYVITQILIFFTKHDKREV